MLSRETGSLAMRAFGGRLRMLAASLVALAGVVVLAVGAPPAISQNRMAGEAEHRSGHLHAFIDHQSGKLIAELPSGKRVATDGSTTDGLEETFRAACDEHLSLRIDGSGNDRGYPGALNLTTPIDFRALRAADGSRKPCPIQGKTIEIGWLTINWTRSQNEADGITFDSIMDLQFRFDGQTVYQGNGCAIAVVPTHPVPVDKFVTAADSVIRIGYPGTQTPTAGCLVKLDARQGAIVNLTLDGTEANGGGCPSCKAAAADGLVLIGGTHGIGQSRFLIGRFHGWTRTGIRCGLDAKDGAGIKGNYFRTVLEPSAVTRETVAAAVSCADNEWHLAIDGNEAKSNAFTGIKVAPGIAGNVFVAPRNDARVPVAGRPADIARNVFIPSR